MTTPTGGNGTDGANLILGVDTKDGIKNVDQLEKSLTGVADTADLVGTKIGTATIRSVKSLKELGTGAAVTKNEFDKLQQSILDVLAAEKEADRIRQATIASGTRLIAQLADLNATFGMSTAELQTYRAGLLNVSEAAAPLIANLEAMKVATAQYGVVIKDVGEIDAARMKWEEANMTALNAQRTRSLAENAAAEESAQTALNAQRKRALAEQAALEESAMTSLNAQRIRSLEEQAAFEESARTALNAQRIRSIRENEIAEVEALKASAMEKLRILQEQDAAQTALNAQRIRAITEQAELENSARISLDAQRIREQTAQAEREESARIALNAQRIRSITENEAKAAAEAIALAEKQAIEEIRWGEMSLKARIDQLKLLKEYQASNVISPQTTASTFSSAAFNDLPNLAALQEKYAATLSHSHRASTELAAGTNALSDAFSNNRVRTEAIVLAHEGLQGRWTRMPGSLMVMMEYLTSAGVAFVGVAGMALAAAAGVAAFFYEIHRGQEQTHELVNALIRTNDASGATRDSLETMAQAVGKVHGSYTEAYEAAALLTKSGKFTAEQINEITKSAADLEHMFGTKVNATIKEFESLSIHGTNASRTGIMQVSTALDKLDQQYHFVNATLMERIIQLEKEGKAEEASTLAIKAYVDETQRAADESEKNLGWMQKLWNGITWSIRGTIQAIADVGKMSTLANDEQTLINKAAKNSDGSLKTDRTHMGKTDILVLDQLIAKQKEMDDLNQKSIKIADDRNKQSDASHALALRAVEDGRIMRKTQTELDAALERNKTQNEQIEAADPGYMVREAKYLQEREDAIRAFYAKRKEAGAKGQDDRVKILQDELLKNKTELESDRSVFDARLSMADLYHKKFNTTEADYYGTRENARAEFIAQEAILFAKDASLLANFAKDKHTPEELAENKKRYDALLKQHQEFLDKLRNQKGGEAVTLMTDVADIQNESDDRIDKHLSDLYKQAEAAERLNKKREESKVAIEQENVAIYEQAVANMKLQATEPVDGTHTQASVDAANAMLPALEAELALRKRIAEATHITAQDTSQKKLINESISDWKRLASSISEGLSGAFGKGGKAAGDMFKAFAENAARQLELNKQLEESTRGLGEKDPERIELTKRKNQEAASANLKAWGDMTTAAQTYFDEGSRGYQAMAAASAVLRTAEMAISVVKGVNAVLTQGGGDPYSAFARMAAMAAVVAGLGVALSGGISGQGGKSAADVQKEQGAGGVFGDTSAKSNSIARGIELFSKNSSIELVHTAGMLEALRNIEASMGGLNNLIARSTGVTDGGNFNVATGQIDKGKATDLISGIGSTVMRGLGVGSIGDKVIGFINNLWGKTNQNLVDSGIQFGGSVSDLQSGRGYDQYASVDKTTSSWFGLSKKTTNSVQTQGLSSELSQQFGLIFTNLETALKGAADSMGVGAAQVEKAFDTMKIEETKLSLKGLTGQALTDALNAVISKTMDQMAEAALPQFDKFRKVGEGYAETVMRVASDYTNIDNIMKSMGTTFGSVGLGSLNARERLVELAGGIDKLASDSAGFVQNFLSKSEQLAPVASAVNDQLKAMGLSFITNREIFKEYVLHLDKSVPAEQDQFVALMALQDAFAKTHAATVDLTKTEQEIADERTDLQKQLDQLTLSSAAMLAKQREAIDESNRALWDQVQAAQAAKDAQDAAKTSLTDTISKMKSFAETTRSLHDSLLLGDKSMLTPMQKYEEARRQYDQTKSAAMNGDTTAQGKYQSMLEAFIQASDVVNSHDSQYSSDLAGVLKDSEAMSAWADKQVDVAQAGLDAMNKQVDALATLNQTAFDIKNYIVDVSGLYMPKASMPTNFSQTQVVDITPLADQVAALTAEVSALRKEQSEQTDGIIGATVSSNQANAATVVAGVNQGQVNARWAADNEEVALR